MVLINHVCKAFMSELSLLQPDNLTPNHQLQLTPMAHLNIVLGSQGWYVTFATITDIYR